jgi:ABC-type transporter Mla subunit MlaD
MSDRAYRFRLGIFVVITLVLLAALVIMFGSVNTAGWFRRVNQFTITYDDAAGITPGAPVRRSGVRIGEVGKVELNDETGKVSVIVDIDKRFSIRMNEKPTIVTSVIGGDAAIEFIATAKPDRTAVPAGATIDGERQPTFSTLVRNASEVDMRKLVASLDRISPATEDTLREIRDLARETRAAVPEVRKTNAQVQEFVKTINDTVPDVKETNKELQQLIKDAGEVVKAIKEEVPEFRKTNREYQKLARTINDAVPDVMETNKEIQKFMKSVNEITPEVRQTNKEVQAFVKSLNETMPDIRDTNKELQKLIKSVNELTPDVKTTVRDIGATAQQYNKLGEDFQKLLRENEPKINRIVDNINASLDRFMDLLSKENVRNVTDTLRNIRDTSEKLPEMSKNLDETLKDARATSARARESMNKADEVITNLEKATKPFAERGPNLVKNLDEVLDKTNRILGDLRDLLRVIGESDGTLRRILNDPALYNHIDDLVCGLNKMLPRVDRMLKDFELFADKLARHPESIGIGGVVRPGSGLKDPPAAIGPPTFPPGHH